MTATEMVGIIAAALFEVRDDAFDVDTWEEIDSTDREEYECQARAVLAALTEAGTVEWGTEHVIDGKRTIESHVWPDRNTAKNKVAIFGGRVVSRLTLPWTVVEQ